MEDPIMARGRKRCAMKSKAGLILLIFLAIYIISCKEEIVKPKGKEPKIEKTKESLITLPGQAKKLQSEFKSWLLSKDTKISQDFEDYIQRLTNSLIGTTDPKSKAIVFYEIGLAKSYWQAEASGTEEYFMKALENAKTADYERCRAASLAKLAMIEECKGNADKARNQMNLVIKIHQELGLLEELATDFCNIGMIEGNNGNFKKAVEYLEKSLKIAKEIKYDIGIAFSMCNLSAALVGAEEKDRAIELYKALQEYRSFAIPFFSYYRERIFSPEMPPIPKFFSSITGYHNLKAVEGQRIFYNFLPYFLSIKEDPIIPCGFIEAPYFLH